MPLNPKGLQCGTSSVTDPQGILGSTEDGCKGGGYYGSEFQGSMGVTQGDPLTPTIFNMVIDAVVQLWVAVMVESAEERSRLRQEGRHQNSLFYADDGMFASTYPR